jgi:hypothetical protein
MGHCPPEKSRHVFYVSRMVLVELAIYHYALHIEAAKV